MAKLELNSADCSASAEPAYDQLWSRHNAQWRDSAQVTSQWQEAADTTPELLACRQSGNFFETLAEKKITLLVTREYEHLIMGVSCPEGQPSLSFMRMPHPSGMAFDRAAGMLHIASTRNPNQVFSLAPASDFTARLDITGEPIGERPLVPVLSRFLPGCLYMHDLALIGGKLHANAVGHNAVVSLETDGTYRRVWWPACIESVDGPVFGQNHIQLNSIAAGATLKSSYFSASSDTVAELRPGDADYPVDRQGVIFSGATRQVIARGLTRPHSARLNDGSIWVDNSGYGEFGFVEGEKFQPFIKLPGWTRGLCFFDDIAFVGTSRVIPRFSQYAPGLDVSTSICGVHAIDLKSARILGSLIWPAGNQIFAIETVPQTFSQGFPFGLPRLTEREKLLFYTFSTDKQSQGGL